MNDFFILGLPRSRTMWFSSLFTCDGIFCAHEHFSSHKENELLYHVRGYSDTNPLMAPDYRDSPLLIIERNIEDVIDSVYKAFDAPKGIKNWRHCIKEYMKVYKEALDKISPKNCMRVNFDDIDSKLGEIWKFLLPDIKSDDDYLQDHKKRIVKTENRDI